MELLKCLVTGIVLFSLVGCSNVPVDEYRAGCTKVDGSARYGTLTQYVKGDGTGVYVYIGDKLKGKVKVTCSQDTQEIQYGGL